MIWSPVSVCWKIYMDLLMWGEGCVKTWWLLVFGCCCRRAASSSFLSWQEGRVLGLEEERSKTQSLSGSKRREQMRDSLITHSLDLHLHSLFIVHCFYTTMMTSQNTLHSTTSPTKSNVIFFSIIIAFTFTESSRHSTSTQTQTTLSKRYHIFQKILLLSRSSRFEHT